MIRSPNQPTDGRSATRSVTSATTIASRPGVVGGVPRFRTVAGALAPGRVSRRISSHPPPTATRNVYLIVFSLGPRLQPTPGPEPLGELPEVEVTETEIWGSA